ALKRLPEQPVWVQQWPLEKEKLNALKFLVQEQLNQGHIEPSTSPWNTPVFVIKEKSGKWRLLHDLRKINAVMESMGALQPGVPSPTMIPATWDILIVDLEDCFFTIPLHPDDTPKFAFTVPSINHAALVERYQWKVLPQGMKNSPTICQWYVAQALSIVRKQFPGAYSCHYMDDILIATPTKEGLVQIQPSLMRTLQEFGLQIAPEKVQQQPPWKYLGVKILDQTIQPQTIQFSTHVQTLNDAQKLLGIINWVRPYLGLTTPQLSPFFNIIKGDPELTSPRKLTPEAKTALETVDQAITNRQVYWICPEVYITVFVVIVDLHPTGIIGQLHILEWIFLPHRPKKTAPTIFDLIAQLVIKCHQRYLQLNAKDPSKIIPVLQEYFEWCFANSTALQSALQNFTGKITYHLSSHKLLQLSETTALSLKPLNHHTPLKSLTVFTDEFGKTGKPIVTWKDDNGWQTLEGWDSGSPQLLELRAVAMAFQCFPHVPLNIVTDFAYVAGITQQSDRALLKEIDNAALFELLKTLWHTVQARTCPYYILHIWSHTNLPGF
ncbi:POK11 protein, partial [Promerops cafer]|nr:POK11 protein [Promerops cafer]